MKTLNTLIAAACLAMPVAASAATFDTLVYDADGTALLFDSFVTGFNVEGSFFDNATTGSIVNVTGDAAVDGASNVTDIASTLFVNDGADVLLESATVLSTEVNVDADAGTVDTYEILFGGLTGSDVDLFDSSALVVFSFNAEDFALFGTPGPVNAKVYSDLTDVAPIPLPASLPLLGFALGGAFALRRRRKA